MWQRLKCCTTELASYQTQKLIFSTTAKSLHGWMCFYGDAPALALVTPRHMADLRQSPIQTMSSARSGSLPSTQSSRNPKLCRRQTHMRPQLLHILRRERSCEREQLAEERLRVAIEARTCLRNLRGGGGGGVGSPSRVGRNEARHSSGGQAAGRASALNGNVESVSKEWSPSQLSAASQSVHQKR